MSKQKDKLIIKIGKQLDKITPDNIMEMRPLIYIEVAKLNKLYNKATYKGQ
jgi:hypothetical protein